MSYDEIIKKSKDFGRETVESNNELDADILELLKKIYEQYGEKFWTLQVDLIEHFKSYGGSNVRTHLEKLREKGAIDSLLFGTKVVYKWVPQ